MAATRMDRRRGRAAVRAFGLLTLGAAAAAVARPAPAQEAAPAAALPTVESVGVAPLPGSGLPRDRVAGNPRAFSGADLSRDGRLVGGGFTETLERGSASITRNDTGGNPFQPDVQVRGFSASPLLGTPQGLAVYQNGVRINEAFGTLHDVGAARALNLGLSDPRTVAPALPRTSFGGARITS